MSEALMTQTNDDLIELYPYGLVFDQIGTRPIMVFKDKKNEIRVPVWLNPIEAGMTLQSNPKQRSLHSPHRVSCQLIKRLGGELKSCVFQRVDHYRQMATVYLHEGDNIDPLEYSADQVVSLCIEAESKFFCTRAFYLDSRELESDMKVLGNNVEVMSENNLNRHPYLM